MIPLALRFLHVLAASAWFGAALFWPGAVRRALASGRGGLALAGPALTQARAALRLDLVAGVATVLLGFACAGTLGPMRHGLWVGAALAVARLALLLALATPALGRVTAAVDAGDAERARAASKPLPAYAGSAHLLWLLALVTMIWPF